MRGLQRAAGAALCCWFVFATAASLAGAATRCETLRKADANILFCDDFENPAYNLAGPLQAGHAWYQRFGPATSGKNCEGPAAPCAVDVVAAGQCNAAGESGTSCIFDGAQSLGLPYRNGSDGGNLGEFRFSQTPLRTFGVSFAMRFSPTLTFTTPAKFDRLFGPQRDVDGTVHELLGMNTDEGYIGKNAAGVIGGFFAVPRNTPFQATWDQDTCATATLKDKKPCSDQSRVVVLAGQWGENDVHMVAQPNVDGSVYHFPDRAPGGGAARGQWLCIQYHVSNWGTNDTHMRWWVNGKTVIDVDHIDTTRTRGQDKSGLVGMRFEQFTNSAYSGDAYRYEDNVVVTKAAQPVSCSAIGFANINDGPQVVERPGAPTLLDPVLVQ